MHLVPGKGGIGQIEHTWNNRSCFSPVVFGVNVPLGKYLVSFKVWEDFKYVEENLPEQPFSEPVGLGNQFYWLGHMMCLVGEPDVNHAKAHFGSVSTPIFGSPSPANYLSSILDSRAG